MSVCLDIKLIPNNNRVCSICQSTTTTVFSNRRPHWYGDGNGGYNCEPCYKKKVRNSTMWGRRLKKEVFSHYFGPDFKCVDCGINNILVLTIDHEEGGGNQQRIQLFGTSHACGIKFYAWLKRNGFPRNNKFTCRCANCHLIRENERIESRHNNNNNNNNNIQSI